jgi:GTP-binding protein
MSHTVPAPPRVIDAQFLAGASRVEQLPPPQNLEVAFAGRSNVGKSSLMNALLERRKLVRTSSTPGCTRQISLFDVTTRLGSRLTLVDLPGYGYAKVPLPLKAHWQEFINGYFRERQALSGLVVVMDVRHPLREFDLAMLDFARARALPAHCLLTKADKLSRGAASAALLAVKRELGEASSVQLFSSENKQGIDEARAIVTRWLHG